MYNHVLYLSYWVANVLVIYLMSLIFPDNIVLGNFRFNSVESAVYAGFWATVLFWAMWDFVHVRNIKLDRVSGRLWVFWAFNFISFWLVSRFSHIAGFGISSFWWALFVGFFAHLVQRFAWILVVGRSLGRRDYALQ
jgi:hypothetical protein